MPKVSICVPVYNVEKYISRCLDSLINQSLKDIEIIVVNDCTPDASMKIVEEYAEKDNRIIILNHEINSGLMVARRTGYKAATGDYITFCDSDDMLLLNSVEVLYRTAIESGADIVSGDMQRFTDSKDLYYVQQKLLYGSDSSAVYKSLLNCEYTHNLCSKLFKKSLLHNFEYLTLQNATNGEDGILFYQVVSNVKKVVHINEVVYKYYINTQSSTQVRLNERGIRSIVVLNKVRYEYCCKYSFLRNTVNKYISRVMNDLLAQGYGVTLKRILKKENMQDSINAYKMFAIFSISEYIRIMIKRIVKPILRKS